MKFQTNKQTHVREGVKFPIKIKEITSMKSEPNIHKGQWEFLKHHYYKAVNGQGKWWKLFGE